MAAADLLCYFIDRDGTHFAHILNFLRVGMVASLPRSTADQDALAVEADYYGLESLVRAIRMPKIDTEQFLSEKVLAMWQNEEKLRSAYRTNAAGDLDPHQGLLSLFSPDDCSLPLKYEPPEEIGSGATILMDVRGKWTVDGTLKTGQPVSVVSLDAFRSTFNAGHANVLHRLNDVLLEEPVIVAGGSVLRAITIGADLRPPRWWWNVQSDVDLFLYASSRSEANRISRRIWYALAVDLERWVIVRSSGVITIQRKGDHLWGFDQKVQIVLRLYQSPAEVLVGFDCDCCCCAYDGREVWVTPRCLLALRSGANILNPLHAWPNRPSYEVRLAKYAQRGFAVAIPGLDKNRVDYDRIQKTTLEDLKGMARIFKVALAVERDTESVLQDSQLRRHSSRFSGIQSSGELFRIGHGSYSDSTIGVIVPQVYPDFDPVENSVYFHGNSGFPLSRDIRDIAWATIEDASDTQAAVEHVPDRLLDAWQTDKRSREYLNAQSMDKFDLDNQYYAPAYEKEE